MKVSFSKRLAAYIIDYLIVSFAIALITVGFNTSDKYSKEALNLLNSLSNGEITTSEYQSEAQALNYNVQKSEVPINIINGILFFGYFAIFGYLNKGQTLGKKIFKLRIKEKDKEPKLISMIIRSLFIYGIISTVYSAIFVNILNINLFSKGTIIISYLEYIFIIISFFMVMYRKDGRGLHDLIAGTSVIEEVK